MQYLGNMSGSSPVIKKYKASAAHISNIILLRATASDAGQEVVSTTTSMAEALGLQIDAGLTKAAGGPTVYTTSQATLATDGEGMSSVIVNPDQIIRAQMVKGATGTSITQETIATADSTGLTVVGQDTNIDGGINWYTSGSNIGQSRKIESISTVTATMLVPFAANTVGDGFLSVAQQVGYRGWTLTTDLKKVRGETATTTACRMCVIDFELNGSTDSYLHYLLTDMAINPIGA